MKLDKSKISRSYEKNLESGFKNSYKSPIQVIIETKVAEINEKKINRLLEVVTSCDVKIDKDELIQIISDDKYRYMQGFNDAIEQYISHAKWIPIEGTFDDVQCSNCKMVMRWTSVNKPMNYCPYCAAKMDEGEKND